MKLEKYVDKNEKRRRTILITISVIVLISVSLILYKTFASFTESAEFPMMKGKVDYFGNSDIYFAFYKGDEELDEMPQKGNEENLVFDHGECDNGASIIWDSETWGPIVKNLSKSKTKCSLYFKEYEPNAADYIIDLAKTDTTNLWVDDTNDANLRYVGADADVNNYIDIGDSDGDGNPILWRIIGVMNNITNLDNGGQQESLLKIIRTGSIGYFSWDISESEINYGQGVNEWSQADIMKLLNPQDIYSGIPEIGRSLYWNRENGYCYKNNSSYKPCDFTSSGISEEAKKKIAKVRWNTGTIGEKYYSSKISAKYMYEGERSTHNGKEQCESNNRYCNDEVERTTTWDGYIGLIYPSDYGYAVGREVREICLGKSMVSYVSDSCNTNDWLMLGYDAFTITPAADYGNTVFCVSMDFGIGSCSAGEGDYGDILPVVYLKSSTKIIDGNGEKGTPFIAR